MNSFISNWRLFEMKKMKGIGILILFISGCVGPPVRSSPVLAG